MSRRAPLALVLGVLLLAGRQTAADRPQEEEQPLFTCTSLEASYRAPDGARMPPCRWFGYEPASMEILSVKRSFPQPNHWSDLDLSAITAVCDQLWYQGPAYDLETLLADALADWEDAQATGREFFRHPVEERTDCA